MRRGRVDAVLGDPYPVRRFDHEPRGVQRVADGRRQCGVGEYDVVDDAVFADPALSASIRDALDAAGFSVDGADRVWVPEDRVDAPAPHAALDALDALDDVSAVWHNAQKNCSMCYEPLLARRTPSFTSSRPLIGGT